MKEFHVRDFLKDKEFMTIVMGIISSSTENELKSKLVKLDEFVSKQCELPVSTFIFDEKYERLGKFEFDNTIRLTNKFLSAKRNIDLIAVYFHEKRHLLHYMCYLKNDELLGKEILEDVRVYFSKEDATAITGKTKYSGLYGYYEMPIEKDAHKYEYQEIIELLNWIRLHYVVVDKVDERLSYYLECLETFEDAEYLTYVEEGEKKYKARLIVEKEILTDVKRSIDEGVYSKAIRKLLLSKRIYEKLDEEEKNVMNSLFKNAKEKHISMSEKCLDKYIDKEITRVIKEKRFR